MSIRLIAFHLPQFHPIPENDQWWGKGFTEWTNVSKSIAFFRGHDQPRYPADLGFYDLRLPEARKAQADLAKEYGVYGFCYWHYWFHGKRLLERPVEDILKSGEPDFPFCLAWANESWSRSWLGDTKEILIEQKYSNADDINHAKYLASVARDRRYIRVDERPLLLIYRPTSLPDPIRTTETIRDQFAKEGLPNPYLVGINAHSPSVDMRSLGFDSTEHHEPQLGVLPGVFSMPSLWNLFKMHLRALKGEPIHQFSYAKARKLMEANQPSYPHIPCFFIGWDNTPRRGKDAIVISRPSANEITESLSKILRKVKQKPVGEQLCFVNAWNEWAEGMYLEPDQTQGRIYLEAIKHVLDTIGAEQ
jgi:lipopolysaccharide biosynthesis protein